ncbi:MAG: TIGR03790 family protein [Thermoplasmatota archaeon]
MRIEILTAALIICLTAGTLATFVEPVDAEDDPFEAMESDMDPPSFVLDYQAEGLYDGLVGYDDVALIVNDNSEISKEIGTYFAVNRGLPIINIINVSVQDRETIDFDEFDKLARQVKENLSERNLTDKINFMVTTKGVPLRVSSGYYNMNDQRYYSSASVDSELMLLDGPYEGYIHGTGAFENPYGGQVTPFSRKEFGIRLVTRLTGYTKEEAIGLVDLAGMSFGVRGKAFLDMDPRRNSSGGYRQANNWMLNAYEWLRENDYPALLDGENQFITDLSNVSAYYSWGSNDGDWNRGQMTNGGFETGTGGSPSGWILESDGGMALRTEEDHDGGSWSLMLQRTGPGVLRAYQDIPVNYADHRYIADARYRLVDVTSPGARMILEGMDSTESVVWTHTLANRTGTRDWAGYQDPIENETSVVTIRYILELLGEGTVYFDSLNMRVIRPHNQWIPGAIAETCVSTGGRSMTYGTGYGQSLVADLIHDGVTGVKGYTWEPFITAVSHADILIPAYYYGFSLAESYWMGSAAASWMGTVIGDPKCTPYLNERADMGFAEEPLAPLVDDLGVPYLQINLANKGGRYVEEGQVSVYMDGFKMEDVYVSIGPSGSTTVNLSSDKYPVQGIHTFRVVLNEDGNIWEFDPNNNEAEMSVTVNTVPKIGIHFPIMEVNRSETLVFNVMVEDPDRDFDPSRLEIILEDPYRTEFIPEIAGVEDQGDIFNVTIEFPVAWDMRLGSYSLHVGYKDGSNSPAGMDMKKRIRINNALPSVTANIPGSEFMRGGDVTVDISWYDPDTPSGDLAIDVWTERSSGGSMPMTGMDMIDNTSAQALIRIPVEDESQSWEIHVEAVDRDGAISAWQGLIRTYNGIPTLDVLDGGQRITRLETARFNLLYIDPEGLPAKSASMSLHGPVGDPSAGILWEKDIDLMSGIQYPAEIQGSLLSVGNYTLTVSYKDDEGDGGRMSYEDFIEVYNIPPRMDIRRIEYEGGADMDDPTVIKGDSVTVTISVTDPDGPGWGLDIKAVLYDQAGSEVTEVSFDNAGQGEYVGRIQTAPEWDIASYWLKIEVVDDAGDNGTMIIEDLFTLDVEQPALVSGEVAVEYDGNASVFVEFYPGRGSGLPDSVWIYLYDDEGKEVMGIPLEATRGVLYWEGSGKVSGEANFSTVMIVDNIGRTIYYNDTLEITKNGPPEDITTPSADDGDQTLLFLVIGIFIVLLILIIITLLVIVTVRSREQPMQPAPMMPGIAPHAGVPMLEAPSMSRLPPGEAESKHRPALPPPVEAQQVLSPGKELDDGSLYHKPEGENGSGDISAPPKTIPADIIIETEPLSGTPPPSPVNHQPVFEGDVPFPDGYPEIQAQEVMGPPGMSEPTEGKSDGAEQDVLNPPAGHD